MDYISEILFQMAPNVHFISFGLLLLAGFNLPISEDIVFIISASIAATIVPENRYMIFAGCFAGAYISDIIAHLLGRFAGRRILKMEFFKDRIPEEKINRIELYFKKYGGKTLFFGRFVPFGVRNMLFITAGIVKMDILKFLTVDLMALSVTSVILFSLGYSFGKNYRQIMPYVEKYKLVIFIIFILLIVFLYLRKRFNKFDNKKKNKIL